MKRPANALLSAQNKTLKDAGEEIRALNVEATKYLNEVQRLRGVLRAYMRSKGETEAHIETVLIKERAP